MIVSPNSGPTIYLLEIRLFNHNCYNLVIFKLAYKNQDIYLLVSDVKINNFSKISLLPQNSPVLIISPRHILLCTVKRSGWGGGDILPGRELPQKVTNTGIYLCIHTINIKTIQFYIHARKLLMEEEQGSKNDHRIRGFICPLSLGPQGPKGPLCLFHEASFPRLFPFSPKLVDLVQPFRIRIR